MDFASAYCLAAASEEEDADTGRCCYSGCEDNAPASLPDDDDAASRRTVRVRKADTVDAAELPQCESVDYVDPAASPPPGAPPAPPAPGAAPLAPGAPPAVSPRPLTPPPAGERTVVFCVDVSGSMSVTTEVAGHTARALLLPAAPGPGAAPGDAGGGPPVFVSRLQCVRAAVEAQLQQLSASSPDARVGLVAFASDVVVLGDGAPGGALVIAGDALRSWEAVVSAAASYAGLAAPVRAAREQLGRALAGLEEGGQTALGPALLAGIALAGRARGSRVLICTDGLANVGLGSLEAATDAERAEAAQFFSRAAGLAVRSGVSVSVVSIRGSDCRLEDLGAVASQTRGHVTIVDPLRLSDEFSSILSEGVVATHVEARMVLHRALRFRLEPPEALESAGGVERCVRDVGNATTASEVTFQFGVRRDVVAAAPALAEVPFQVQVRYRRVGDGAACLRVTTRMQPLTTRREEAERRADVAVLGTRAAQRAAQLAADGDYSQARAEAFAHKQLMKQVVHGEQSLLAYAAWKSEASQLDKALRHAKRRERRAGLALSDEEEDDEDDAPEPGSRGASPAPPAAEGPELLQQQQQVHSDGSSPRGCRQRDDETAQVIFSMKGWSSAARTLQSPRLDDDAAAPAAGAVVVVPPAVRAPTPRQ
eukprot:m51a1_g7794 hypothetical protein (653) ;mRNA; r:30027-32276